jgi:hypothetical protein
MEAPRSLRAVIRARRGGWRLRIAPAGVLGLVVPVLLAVIAVVLGAAALVVMEVAIAAAIFDVIIAFVGENVNAFAVVAVFLMLPLVFIVGWLMGIGARALAAAAKHLAFGFQRVDIRPAAAPTRIEAAGWFHRSVVEVADLTSVIVRHRDPELEVVLRVGNATLVCPAMAGGPLRRVDPHVLADWLAEVLAPSEISVCHHHATLPLPIGQPWLPANTVAGIWQVPEEDVPMLADCCGVHTDSGSRSTLFNAYDVEAGVERAQAIAANDQQEPSPP